MGMSRAARQLVKGDGRRRPRRDLLPELPAPRLQIKFPRRSGDDWRSVMRRYLFVFLFFIVVFVAGASAHSEIVYSNLGPGDSFHPIESFWISGPATAVGTR